MTIAQSLVMDAVRRVRPQRNKAYEELHRLLIFQQVPPGRLREAEWALKLGVNRAALREALARLEGEGFIAKGEKTGYFRPVLTDQQIREIIEMRTLLEGGAIERICQLGRNDADHLRALHDACEQLELFILNDCPRDVPKADRRFHEALVEAAENRCLARLYHLAPLPIVHPEVLDDAHWKESCHHTLDEHRAILDSMLKGQPDRAIWQLRRHLNKRYLAKDPPCHSSSEPAPWTTGPHTSRQDGFNRRDKLSRFEGNHGYAPQSRDTQTGFRVS